MKEKITLKNYLDLQKENQEVKVLIRCPFKIWDTREDIIKTLDVGNYEAGFLIKNLSCNLLKNNTFEVKNTTQNGKKIKKIYINTTPELLSHKGLFITFK